jgi:hypothetical protein
MSPSSRPRYQSSAHHSENGKVGHGLYRMITGSCGVKHQQRRWGGFVTEGKSRCYKCEKEYSSR